MREREGGGGGGGRRGREREKNDAVIRQLHFNHSLLSLILWTFPHSFILKVRVQNTNRNAAIQMAESDQKCSGDTIATGVTSTIGAGQKEFDGALNDLEFDLTHQIATVGVLLK